MATCLPTSNGSIEIKRASKIARLNNHRLSACLRAFASWRGWRIAENIVSCGARLINIKISM